MFRCRQVTRFSVAACTVVAAAAAISGCGMVQRQMPPAPPPAAPADANLITFATQLRGANEVPPVASQASGSVDALLDTDTNLLRWKVSYTGLSSPATSAHFHGPAVVGANAGVALPWPNPITSPMEGSATLSPAQAADLLAGRWYANIHTATYPGGEVRGQMVVRN